MPSNQENTSARGRRGRRPGANATRQTILDAARARFAADGFTATTIRKIAADAGVDTALVMQFFGSKDELFGTIMSVPPAALTRMSDAWLGPEDGIGERVARAFLDVFENDPEASAPLLAMLRGAIAHDQAATRLREFIETRLMIGAAARLRHDDTRLRVGMAAAMLVGVIIARSVVRVPAVADASFESVVATAAGSLQVLLASSPAERPH
jgi:AcrR family transcriptional regulator